MRTGNKVTAIDTQRSAFDRKSILTVGISFFVVLAGIVFLRSEDTVASTPKVSHVLLISVDGLHALDLANFIKSNPQSNLARLSSHGVVYTQASTSKPSDSFPGLMSIVTGGSPISTGLWYEGAYARDLSPAGSGCKRIGTEIVWDSGIDRDKKLVDGGGIDPAKLPLDPRKGCSAVYPHDFLRVNTVFEVVRQANLHTAWVDKHPSYEMTNGPSGKGVEDLFTPELAASGASHDVKKAELFDDKKVDAVLNEINGKDHSGAKDAPTPSLFGTSLQAFSMGQKLGGYTDEMGTPGEVLSETLRHTDESIGKLLEALRQRNLEDSTLVIVTSKHGESPIDRRKRRLVADTTLEGIMKTSHPGAMTFAYQDGDLASIWLRDQTQTQKVVDTLSTPENESATDVEEILAGEALKLMFNDPLYDARTPDVLLVPRLGGLYMEADTKFLAEHGGFHKQDVNVALLLSRPGLPPQIIKTPVQTTQIAPTILKVLGLNPQALQAVRQERTQELPD
ncbi:MAG: alkaline phosphatase family protein [Candidatus Acidiferrum sp.]